MTLLETDQLLFPASHTLSVFMLQKKNKQTNKKKHNTKQSYVLSSEFIIVW